MNKAIFLRTFLDQKRLRTWIFLGLFVVMTAALVIFPLWEIDQDLNFASVDASYEQTLRDERAQFDSELAWALVFGFPIFNVKLLLLAFAVLAGVSATASEWQDRTMFLLFTKPISRPRIILAKLLGAYSWVAIAIGLIGATVTLAGLMMGMETIWTAAFLGAVVWTILAMAPIVAIGGFAGVMMRRGLPALTLGVALVAIVAPVVGASGYMLAMADADFETIGEYQNSDASFIQACYEDNAPGQRIESAQTQEELESYYAEARFAFAAADACRAERTEQTDQFFVERGVAPEVFGYEKQWCAEKAYYAEANGSTPYLGSVLCREEFPARHAAAEKAILSKFDRPLIDVTRYLSPAHLLHGWESVVGWNYADVNGTSGDVLQFSTWEVVYPNNGAGARPAPLNAFASVAVLLVHTALWPTLAVLAVTRRDLL
jgi:ABC-type transport system involved in multi-copper enzyme maturation permease subunit